MLQVDVRIYNTNTGRLIVDTVELDESGQFEPDGDYRIAGFSGSGSRIDVSFIDPAGSMTGKLLPTGRPEESLLVDFGDALGGELAVQVTLMDAANPFIFVDQASLPHNLQQIPLDSPAAQGWVEEIRRAGAVRYGLAPTTEEAARVRGTPKIAFLRPASFGAKTDIQVTAYSMGRMHPSLQLTGAVCLAAALCTPGTVASRLSANRGLPLTPPGSDDGEEQQPESEGAPDMSARNRSVFLEHPTGQIVAVVQWSSGADGDVTIDSVKLARTAKRLFVGNAIVGLPAMGDFI